jgi:3D (Asp-Asp-Asp) domain-containing protein
MYVQEWDAWVEKKTMGYTNTKVKKKKSTNMCKRRRKTVTVYRLESNQKCSTFADKSNVIPLATNSVVFQKHDYRAN